MKAQDILGSPPFVMLGMAISRTLPPRPVYWLAGRIARYMAWRRNTMFSIVRENLAHLEPDLDDAGLDAMAEQAIYHAGCTYFDMFRLTMDDYRRGRAQVRINPDEWALARDALMGERGTIIVGPHLSNFDLAAQWFAAQGLEIQALSLAEPDMGTRVLNRLRQHRGVTMTPVAMNALRLAVARLRRGGVVMTGVDRPVSSRDEPIPFFGAPARLPTGYARLALQTNSCIVVACCVQDADGCYAIHIAPPLEMERTGRGRDEDERHNALRVLSVIERMIRMAPSQWLMFVPVWRPEDAEAAPDGGDEPTRMVNEHVVAAE
jgi:KDO2-lipid IV(A) lauroyltransferase